MVKKRISIHSSPEFHQKLLELKRRINSKLLTENREGVSIRELTEELAKTDILNQLETSIMKKRKEDIKIRYDRRKW